MKANTYQNILLILAMDIKSSAKKNKLLKIAIETEDKTLSSLCTKAANIYGYYIERFKLRIHHHIPNPAFNKDEPRSPNNEPTILDTSIPYNHNQWVAMLAVEKANLEKYVTEAMANGKPSWQIEAERNGWTPPAPIVEKKYFCTFCDNQVNKGDEACISCSEAQIGEV